MQTTTPTPFRVTCAQCRRETSLLSAEAVVLSGERIVTGPGWRIVELVQAATQAHGSDGHSGSGVLLCERCAYLPKWCATRAERRRHLAATVLACHGHGPAAVTPIHRSPTGSRQRRPRGWSLAGPPPSNFARVVRRWAIGVLRWAAGQCLVLRRAWQGV